MAEREQGKRAERRLIVVLAAAAAALAGLGLLGLAVTVAADGLDDWRSYVTVGLVALGGLFLWFGLDVARRHFISLERLRGAVVTLAADPSARLPILEDPEVDLEVRRFHGALQALVARHARERAAPDNRLEAVLASIPDAMLVISEDGQVSLVNHAAKSLLGAERVAVGSSVFAALSRTTVYDAVERARAAGQPVNAMIGTLEDHQLAAKVASLDDSGGAVITIPAEEVTFRAELDVDLDLLDRPPVVEPMEVSDDTPLERLPFLVLDTETTGLDVAQDRVVSIGAVPLFGGRLYRAGSFDRLVNPGVKIPARSTAIHGITDAMVRDAPAFAEVFAAFGTLLSGNVAVGHQIAFDLAMLRGECLRSGLAWSDPRSLDTLLLATALDPNLSTASLDAVAEQVGVTVRGRHTALGDSLVTAEVFLRLLPRLADRGVTTLGQATAFSRRAKRLLEAQQKAGW